MAADEVKMKLVFANDNASAELVVAMSTLVSEVKSRILQEYWPASMPSLDTIERVRLFAGGREIGGKDDKDTIALKDSNLAVITTGAATPVHVVPVSKSSSPSPSGSKEGTGGESSQCFCILL
eukprot:TRINITY_DN79141_c0_g1_i1.p1 TRINITY_DN79141_c0_g1~~TRINITY_DN79141_c0_g1_i1.p1  ORF type:complete len:123 (+),score=30.71 TRINITY_DN79141_c0_g1_i1:91-459(+)